MKTKIDYILISEKLEKNITKVEIPKYKLKPYDGRYNNEEEIGHRPIIMELEIKKKRRKKKQKNQKKENEDRTKLKRKGNTNTTMKK